MDDPKATTETVEPQAQEAGPDDRPDDRPDDGAQAGSKVDPSELTIALTPRQILGGFALLAALVMLLRRNRGRDRGRG